MFGYKTNLNLDDEVMLNQIWDIQDNLILRKDGSVSAIYEIPSKVVNSRDGLGKEKLKEINFSVLSELHTYHDLSIRTVPVDQDLSERFGKLMQDIDWKSETAYLAEYVLDGMVQKLYSSIGVLYDYKHYLIVPLKSIHISKDLKEVAKQSYKKVRNLTLGFLGLGEGISKDWKADYRTQLTILEGLLSDLSARPLSRLENLLLIVYNGYVV
ncbi:hypothetical protein [Streptococcus mutans]|uniref:hypothetical protein n=1 Tax=Streptococcus mutans TaxID=1309 RepID=UPI001D107537|nr:hypothetical protein [Streptococcus mutans]